MKNLDSQSEMKKLGGLSKALDACIKESDMGPLQKLEAISLLNNIMDTAVSIIEGHLEESRKMLTGIVESAHSTSIKKAHRK